MNNFIEILQGVYTVLPILSNERLIRQSGAFLLPGKFNFSITKGEEKNGYMYKSKCNLLDEFEKEFFYIKPENKEEILAELEACNINDSSMLPELEHQLMYIRKINESKKQKVPYYEEFQESNSVEIERGMSNAKLNYKVTEKAINNIVKNKEIVYKVLGVLEKNASIDWIKRDSVISRMKMDICKTLIGEGEEKQCAYNKADEIMKIVVRTNDDLED